MRIESFMHSAQVARKRLRLVGRWRRFARTLFLTLLGLGAFTHVANGQGASSVAYGLSTGSVGSLRIGMPQQEVESLLQRRLAEDLEDQTQFALVSFGAARDLQSLGIDHLAGLGTAGVDLTFTAPVGNERRLLAVRISVSCEDLPELALRLGAWETPDPKPVYAWGVLRKPYCHLSLWKASGLTE